MNLAVGPGAGHSVVALPPPGFLHRDIYPPPFWPPPLKQTFYATFGVSEPVLDDGQYMLDPYADQVTAAAAGAPGAGMAAPPPRPPKRSEMKMKKLTLSDVEIDRTEIQLFEELGKGEFGTVKKGASPACVATLAACSCPPFFPRPSLSRLVSRFAARPDSVTSSLMPVGVLQPCRRCLVAARTGATDSRSQTAERALPRGLGVSRARGARGSWSLVCPLGPPCPSSHFASSLAFPTSQSEHTSTASSELLAEANLMVNLVRRPGQLFMAAAAVVPPLAPWLLSRCIAQLLTARRFLRLFSFPVPVESPACRQNAWPQHHRASDACLRAFATRYVSPTVSVLVSAHCAFPTHAPASLFSTPLFSLMPLLASFFPHRLSFPSPCLSSLAPHPARRPPRLPSSEQERADEHADFVHDPDCRRHGLS